MEKRFKLLFALGMLAILLIPGCGQEKAASKEKETQKPKTVHLATATSAEDSGLLGYILPELEKDIGYKVEVTSIGTGQAIKLGEAGNVDVILANNPAAEDKFIADEFGVDRREVMYNDFLLIGPKEDPAKIKDEQDVAVAFKKIADAKAKFVSRGDSSGTHAKELSLWEAAGVVLESNQEWYIETGQGMRDTFRKADGMKAYTLIDRATYLSNKDKNDSIIMVEGDERLLNPYGVISVNPKKFPRINYEGATKFRDWLVSEKGQQMIGEYGVEEYGLPLFFPDAK
ncbi:MAG: solute-binding protein [Syntrophomonadaceae bacterium]|nr:solute-binding protein [Syntrophomonadaceae bacterium]